MGYKITLTERIQQLLRDNLGGAFKQYFNGDPIMIAQSYLPAICIVRRGSEQRSVATGIDERIVTVLVRVVFNKKDEFGKGQNETTVQKTMENLIEGIDDTTNSYHSNSIIGLLRTNFTLASTVLENDEVVEYLINNNRPDVITMEAEITCHFRERFVVART